VDYYQQPSNVAIQNPNYGESKKYEDNLKEPQKYNYPNLVEERKSIPEYDSQFKPYETSGSLDSTRDKEKVYYFNREELERVNIPPGEKRTIICNEIAKFYIKIAHLFAAVVTTISPEYEYTDYWGRKVKKSFFEKDSIPKGVDVKVTKLNLCSKNVEKLTGDNNDEILKENPDDILVKPNLCKIDIDEDEDEDEETVLTLDSQPGINQLEELYFDDDYDLKTGKFNAKSAKMAEQYRNDLQRFYENFTGSTMPPDIERFGQIKLKDFNKSKLCSKIKESQKKTGEEKKASVGNEEVKTSISKPGEYKGTYRDTLFSEYASNLRQMVSSVNEKQDKLIKIIDKIFIVYEDPTTKKKHIRINPELNMDSLDVIIEEARHLIVDLYLSCENDFTKGVKIYEAIVDSLIATTVENQIDKLEEEKLKLTELSSHKQDEYSQQKPELSIKI
jgi:hypothetical protein